LAKFGSQCTRGKNEITAITVNTPSTASVARPSNLCVTQQLQRTTSQELHFHETNHTNTIDYTTDNGDTLTHASCSERLSANTLFLIADGADVDALTLTQKMGGSFNRKMQRFGKSVAGGGDTDSDTSVSTPNGDVCTDAIEVLDGVSIVLSYNHHNAPIRTDNAGNSSPTSSRRTCPRRFHTADRIDDMRGPKPAEQAAGIIKRLSLNMSRLGGGASRRIGNKYINGRSAEPVVHTHTHT
jgi:hypothetical protein